MILDQQRFGRKQLRKPPAMSVKLKTLVLVPPSHCEVRAAREMRTLSVSFLPQMSFPSVSPDNFYKMSQAENGDVTLVDILLTHETATRGFRESFETLLGELKEMQEETQAMLQDERAYNAHLLSTFDDYKTAITKAFQQASKGIMEGQRETEAGVSKFDENECNNSSQSQFSQELTAPMCNS
eukprot:Lankesteria_metandrocarpae@DN1713_c0_g1_i1.p1